MKTTEQAITVGTPVSYEDMANPLCSGVVTGIDTSKWGTRYLVKWSGRREGQSDYSDLRQRGWTIG